MNKLNLENPGGLPGWQNVLAYWQASILTAFSAMCKVVGENVIIEGVEVDGGNLTDGILIMNNELFQFVGGPNTGFIDVVQTPVQKQYTDGVNRDLYLNRNTAPSVSGIPYSSFKRLTKVENIIPEMPILKTGSYTIGNLHFDDMFTIVHNLGHTNYKVIYSIETEAYEGAQLYVVNSEVRNHFVIGERRANEFDLFSWENNTETTQELVINYMLIKPSWG